MVKLGQDKVANDFALRELIIDLVMPCWAGPWNVGLALSGCENSFVYFYLQRSVDNVYQGGKLNLVRWVQKVVWCKLCHFSAPSCVGPFCGECFPDLPCCECECEHECVLPPSISAAPSRILFISQALKWKTPSEDHVTFDFCCELPSQKK